MRKIEFLHTVKVQLIFQYAGVLFVAFKNEKGQYAPIYLLSGAEPYYIDALSML